MKGTLIKVIAHLLFASEEGGIDLVRLTVRNVLPLLDGTSTPAMDAWTGSALVDCVP